VMLRNPLPPATNEFAKELIIGTALRHSHGHHNDQRAGGYLHREDVRSAHTHPLHSIIPRSQIRVATAVTKLGLDYVVLPSVWIEMIWKD